VLRYEGLREIVITSGEGDTTLGRALSA